MPDAKRLLDLLLSGAGLVTSAPLWAIIAALIKLQDGGPVFFSQERVGRHGRTFRALKFRSMIPDAERDTGVRYSPAYTTRGSPGWDACCARQRWTNCLNSGTSFTAT